MEASYCLLGSVLDIFQGVPFWYRGPEGDVFASSITAWLIEQGEVGGVGMAGTTVVQVVARDDDTVRRLLLIDEEGAPEVVQWVSDAFGGRLGGPLEELAARAGGNGAYLQVPINYRLGDWRVRLAVPGCLSVRAAGRRVPSSHPAGSAGPWEKRWIGEGSEAWARMPENLSIDLAAPRVLWGHFRLAS